MPIQFSPSLRSSSISVIERCNAGYTMHMQTIAFRLLTTNVRWSKMCVALTYRWRFAIMRFVYMRGTEIDKSISYSASISHFDSNRNNIDFICPRLFQLFPLQRCRDHEANYQLQYRFEFALQNTFA